MLWPLMDLQLESDRFAAARRDMVAEQLRSRGLRNERVLQAMERVPRHRFVAEDYRNQAYEDHPIPIGQDQTISQPYIVGLMLEALALESTDTVLEIGGGSGYQTALLAELSQKVYSIERHEALATVAKATLELLGYASVLILVGDGSKGLPEFAPYEAIIVSAAAPRIPQPLFDQLREGGRLVLPVGPPRGQELELVKKQEGRAVVASLGGCAFVPLIGNFGYSLG